MALDVKEIKDQLQNQRKLATGLEPPEKVRMRMKGGDQEFMVLRRDERDFMELGYELAPADPVHGFKQGEYRPGKFALPETKAKVPA